MSTAILPSIAPPQAPVTAPPLLTAEEFVERYEGQRVELNRGVVEELPMPWNNHGRVCLRIGAKLLDYADQKDCGHVTSNDSWMKTRRSPDSVRGPDISYFSYERQPKGPLPEGFLARSPELVVEVKSPSDSWPKIMAKANEYLTADVLVVVILDPVTQSTTVCRVAGQTKFAANQDLTIPDLFPGLTINLGSLFA